MNKLGPLLLAILAFWCLFGAWYMQCEACKPRIAKAVAPAAAAAAPVAKAATTAFSIADRNAFSTKSIQHFTFPKASDAPTIPAKARESFQSLATYLKKNPDRQAMLTGYYEKTEKNNTSFGNLGIARAEAIKKKMIAWGAPAATVYCVGKMQNGLDFKNNLLHNGVKFTFRNTPNERLLKPLNVYFQSGSNTIIENDDLRNYFKELRGYTTQNPKAKVTITGHTDSKGDAAKNLQLGQERADFIRGYLMDKGYKRSMFSTGSKGITAPIADNNTAEGRAKNRRVEIRLSE